MMYMNTTTAAALLGIKETELVQWKRAGVLEYRGVKVDVAPPATQHQAGTNVKRKFEYDDLLRCQKDLQLARLQIELESPVNSRG